MKTIFAHKILQMTFEQVVGQKELLNQLKKMVDEDKMPHAIFLNGQSGYGPLAIALAISSYILTPKEERENLPESKSYQKATKYIHPDLNFAFPVVKHNTKKRAETTSKDFINEWRTILSKDGYQSDSEWIISISSSTSVGDINVSECNQIFNNLSLKPFESEHKVQIIWMPQYLGNNGNKLLKLIEEPPRNSIIIFVGNSIDTVLKTITSRCQIINVPRISDETLQLALEHKHQLDSEIAKKVSFLAEGNYSKAKTLLSIKEDISLDFILEWLEIARSRSALDIRNWINKFIDLGKEEQKGLLIYFLKTLIEVVHIRFTGIEMSKLNDRERIIIQKNVTLNNLTIEHIGEISDVVNETYVLLQRNANPRILLFQGSLLIGKIFKKSTLATEV